MGRSQGFASIAIDIVAHLRLGFPLATILKILTEPMTITRRVIMQKARRHPLDGLRPLVGKWFQVLSLPYRGSFHLSLALLCTIGR